MLDFHLDVDIKGLWNQYRNLGRSGKPLMNWEIKSTDEKKRERTDDYANHRNQKVEEDQKKKKITNQCLPELC